MLMRGGEYGGGAALTWKDRANRARSWSAVGAAAMWLVFALVLLVIGALTALAPLFVVRLAPLVLIPVVIAIAMLARRSDEPDQRLGLRWLTVMLAVFSLFPTYMIFKAGSLPAVDVRRVVAILSLLALTYLLASRPTVRRHFTGDGDRATAWVGLCIGGYVTWRIASSFVTPFPMYGIINTGWDVLYYYGMYFVAICLFQGERSGAGVMRALFLMMVGIAVLVVVERLKGINPLVVYAPKGGTGGPIDAIAAMQSISRDRDGQFRAQGTFEHPITLAEYASIVSCFAAAALLWPGRRAGKVLAAAALAASLGCIALSGSRSGLVCAGIGMLLVFVLWMYRAREEQSSTGVFFKQVLVVSTLAGVLLATAPVLLLLTQGRSYTEYHSSMMRARMLHRGLPSVLENPVIGSGIGMAGRIAGEVGRKGVITLDNQMLGIALESGVPAVLLFVASLVIPAIRAAVAVLSRPGPQAAFLAGGVGVMAVLVVIRGTMWLSTNLTIGYLIAGMMMLLARRRAEPAPGGVPADPPPAGRHAGRFVAAAAASRAGRVTAA